MNILLKQLGIRSKLNLPYYKIIWITLDEFRSSGHNDLTRNTSDKSVDPEEENLHFIFLDTRDSDTVAWKSTCNWNLCVEYLLDHNCLLVHPTLSTRRGRPWRWATVWRTENCHGADEVCYTACGPHISVQKLKSVTFYVVQLKLSMKNSVWKIRANWVPQFFTEAQKWRVSWTKHILNCHVLIAVPQTTDWCCQGRWNLLY